MLFVCCCCLYSRCSLDSVFVRPIFTLQGVGGRVFPLFRVRLQTNSNGDLFDVLSCPAVSALEPLKPCGSLQLSAVLELRNLFRHVAIFR